ncbi:MAG: hypothetical protein ACLFUO_05070 [Candidatus Woesearchaeota archaeon]
MSDYRRKSKQKNIPNLYLFTQLSLIAYGAFANTTVFLSENPVLRNKISNINIIITIIWMLSNLILFIFFNTFNYEKEARIFSGYNFLINAFNLSNILFQYIDNWRLLFYFSVTVKLFELTACIILLRKNKNEK